MAPSHYTSQHTAGKASLTGRCSPQVLMGKAETNEGGTIYDFVEIAEGDKLRETGPEIYWRLNEAKKVGRHSPNPL